MKLDLADNRAARALATTATLADHFRSIEGRRGVWRGAARTRRELAGKESIRQEAEHHLALADEYERRADAIR